jgi:hypothetical protein
MNTAAYTREKAARIKEIKKQGGINAKPKSLSIRVQEMEKYDWNPSMRFLLLILVLGTRREKEDYSDTWMPEGCPWTAEEMVGWCDMAQWRLAQRVGLTKDHINKMLAQLEEDGFILKEIWQDELTKAYHCRYQVVEAVVDANQRPENTEKAPRGKRYKEGSRKATPGSFTTVNQPRRSAQRKAIMEEDDE